MPEVAATADIIGDVSPLTLLEKQKSNTILSVPFQESVGVVKVKVLLPIDVDNVAKENTEVNPVSIVVLANVEPL